MSSAGSQRKLWVLFCVQKKQKAQHCLLCIVPVLPLWIYKYDHRNSCARRSLSTQFPALSGSSGVSVTPFTIHLPGPQGSARAYEPPPLSPIPEYFHSIHLCLDTECLNAVAGGVLKAHWQEGASSRWYEQHDHQGRWTVTALCSSEDGWRWEGISFCELFQGLAHLLHDIAAFVPQCLQIELNQGCKPEHRIHVFCRLMTDSIKW